MSDTTKLGDVERHSFASDNYAGAHPQVLTAIMAANGSHQESYGADAYTERLQQVFATHFGEQATGLPVWGGTAANVIALQYLVPRWGAVICAASAHINTNENGAAERVGGIKLLPVPTPDGKLTPELIDREAWGFDLNYRAQPAAVSISQCTEHGTSYTPSELRAICEHAHSLGLKVHLDGARLANAAAFLGTGLGELTTAVGVDVVSLGGTKLGAVSAEAVIVFERSPTAISTLQRLQVGNMQCASKMRFLSAQHLALWSGELWRELAQQANSMASRLAAGVRQLSQVKIIFPVESNAVFVILDRRVAEQLRTQFRFYDWDHGAVRWMCSWDTAATQVDALLAALQSAIAEDLR